MPYSRVHRLLRILTLVQSGHGWNADRLAEACETSSRNIYRDLKMLEGAGIPYHFDEASGGYRVGRQFFMPPVELTFEEALALACLVEQVARNDQVPFMSAAGKAISKIRSQLPASVSDELASIDAHMNIHLAAAMPSSGIEDVYETARQAIANRRALMCSYESMSSRCEPTRKNAADDEEVFNFRPYALLFNQRAWYVIGYHDGRQAIRCLKLNRFTRIDLTQTPYAIPDDFSVRSYLGKAWRLIPAEQEYAVELHFDADFAETIADTHWHDTQEIEWLDDGSILFRCEVAGLDEIVWWVLSMGPHCVVRHPQQLADRVRQLAQQTADRYTG